MTLTLLLPAVLLWATPVRAQSGNRPDWNDPRDPLTNAIGLHMGEMGGNGLSFRLPLRWYLYAQITGGIWHTGEDKKHNLGLELNYILRQDDQLRLFLSAGLANFYHKELVTDTAAGQVWSKENNRNLGAGVGLEYLLGARLAGKVELDFAHTEDDDSITVIPQVGLYFYW
ncbi:hypothetical protein CSB20_14790 [bacterium DOLZORAL124_64_63]|nr:MAG: hypothetical protein CSB20_14790 [bacterium DOLZORAL124_64_63]